MKKSTRTIIVAALSGDDTVRPDQREAALAILSERVSGSQATLPMLVTKAEAARLLSTSTSSIFRMVRDGQLNPVWIRGGLRRYRVEELEKLSKNGKG